MGWGMFFGAVAGTALGIAAICFPPLAFGLGTAALLYYPIYCAGLCGGVTALSYSLCKAVSYCCQSLKKPVPAIDHIQNRPTDNRSTYDSPSYERIFTVTPPHLTSSTTCANNTLSKTETSPSQISNVSNAPSITPIQATGPDNTHSQTKSSSSSYKRT